MNGSTSRAPRSATPAGAPIPRRTMIKALALGAAVTACGQNRTASVVTADTSSDEPSVTSPTSNDPSGNDPSGEVAPAPPASIPPGASVASAEASLLGDQRWLFLGDSITVMSLSGREGDLIRRVADIDASRSPRISEDAVGGTGTQQALESIDRHLASFAGRFIVLGYGTNDYPPDFRMESVVERVIAAGRSPVVPRAPWSTEPANAAQISENNRKIDALYSAYPAIVRGPDLFAAFRNRTELFQPGDVVHPNEEGQRVWRQEWAEVIAAFDPLTPIAPPRPPPGEFSIDRVAERSSLRTAARLG